VFWQPWWQCYCRTRYLRHHAIYPSSYCNLVCWSGLQHGQSAVGSWCTWNETFSPQCTHYDSPAIWRCTGEHSEWIVSCVWQGWPNSSSSVSLQNIFWMNKEIDMCDMFLLNTSDSNLRCIGLMLCVCHMSQRNFSNKIVIYCQPLQQSLAELEVTSACFSFSVVSWSVWYTALGYQMLSISHFPTIKCSSVQKVSFSFVSFFHICDCFFWYDIGNA